MLIHLLIYLISLILPVYGWIESCPNGYKRCASTDQPYTITTPTTLSNCVYDGCPQIVVTGAPLIVDRVTFKNSVTTSNSLQDGGCIYLGGLGSSLTVTNGKFINCTAASSGGAIQATLSTDSVFLENTDFIGCSAGTQGGAINLLGTSDLTSINCNYLNSYSQVGGAVNMGGGHVTIIGGSCMGCTSISLGGCFNLGNENNSIRDFRSINNAAGYGAVFALNGSPTNLNMTNCTVINNEQPIYHYANAEDWILITNSVFDGTVRELTFTAESLVQFKDVVIRNSVGNSVSGLVSSRYLSLTRVTIDGGINLQSIIYTIQTNITNVVIQNVKSIGLPLSMGCYANIKGLVLRNVSTTYPEVVGIGYWPDSKTCKVVFRIHDSIIEDNLIKNKNGVGFLHLFPNVDNTDQSRFDAVIGSNVTIRNNNMIGSGAVIYADTLGNFSFGESSIGIKIYNNKGTRFDSPILAYFTMVNSYLMGNLRGTGNQIEGAIYYQQNVSSTVIKKSSYLSGLLPPGITYTSPASYLSIVNAPQMETSKTSIYRSQRIPTLQITAFDYFGNVALIDKKQFVIVRITETLRSAVLTGETIKAIIQEQNNPISFNNLGIKSVQPGNYLLSVEGINLTPSPVKSTILNVSLAILDCNAQTEMFIESANTCFTLKSMTVMPIQAIGGIAIFLLLLSVLVFSLFFLSSKQKESLKANNCFWFKSISLVGSLLCYASFIPHLNRSLSAGCMISAWLYNLGFVLIMVPVIARVFELQAMAFGVKEGKKVSHSSHIAFIFVLMTILLLVWTATDSSGYQNLVLYSSNQVVVDYCSQNAFTSITIVVRLLFSLGAALSTYLNKGVQEVFPEVRNLIILCYNWFIFGGVLGLIAQLVIENPDNAFILFALSVLFPTTMGFVLVFTADMSIRKGVYESSIKGTSSNGRVSTMGKSAHSEKAQESIK